MTEQNRITRDDLYYPSIAAPRELWVFSSDIVGAVALWAVKQSPYAVPDNLETVLKALHEIVRPSFNEVDMRKFSTIDEIEGFVSASLRVIPEYMAWNERKNGNDAAFKFTSRYDGPGNPDDDFIDLGALERNVAMHITQQCILT